MKVDTLAKRIPIAALLACKMFASITKREEKLLNPVGAAHVSFTETRPSPTREPPSIRKMSASADSAANAVPVTSYCRVNRTKITPVWLCGMPFLQRICGGSDPQVLRSGRKIT